MPSHSFRFDEVWDIPDATPAEVYDVLAHGELLPKWWKGVYLEAELFEPGREPHISAKLRAKARGFLPYKLDFILEVTELVPEKLVAVKVVGDFDGYWRAALSPTRDGTHVDLTWTTTLNRPWMKRLAPLLRPVFAWNHYWTTPRGEAGLKAFLAERLIRAPIIINEASEPYSSGDVDFYDSVKEACSAMEPVDVEAHWYYAFDANGVRLQICTDGKNIWFIRTADINREGLVQLVTDFLGRIRTEKGRAWVASYLHRLTS